MAGDIINPQFNGSVFSHSQDGLVVEPGFAIKVTVASGAGVLTRGTVLGLVTASGKYIKSLSGASDGSQTPSVILAADVDATSADVQAMAFREGQFDASKVTLGASHTVASTYEALRTRRIFLVNTIG